MKVVDLFSGCGGISYGLEQQGFDVRIGIDIDNSAIATFSGNHDQSVGLAADINVLTGEEILSEAQTPRIDIVVGGPPCQGFSLSGARRHRDPRNKLYLSFIRLVEELSPRVVIIENVPGMVSLYKGAAHREVVANLSSLKYTVTHKVLRASDYGVPQHRRRVFYVGIKGKEFEFPSPTHIDPGENDLFKSGLPPMVTCAEAIGDLPLLQNDIGEAVQDYESLPENQYQVSMRSGSKDIRNHIAARHSERIKNIIRLVPAGKNYKSLPPHLRNTRNFHVAWTRFPDNTPAPTIDTGHRHHFHYKADRVPTVRECARIQSFPDRFTFLGNKTEQFRQVGNAVPPILATVLAAAIGDQL